MVADAGVQSLPIVELSELHDVGDGLDVVFKRLVVNELRFHAVKEGFHPGIVQRVALAAHAAHHARVDDCIAVVVGGVFSALIGVKQATRPRRIAMQGHAQCTFGQLGVALAAERPAHHLATVKIQHHRVVKPAAAGFDVGENARPLLACTSWFAGMRQLITGR